MEQQYNNKFNLENQSNRMPFRHLNITQRKQLEHLLNLKESKDYVGPKITLRYIATRLGCHYSTVCREIKKGKFKISKNGLPPADYYCYDYGQAISESNAKRSHYSNKIDKTNIHLKNVLLICKKEKISLENAIYIYETSTKNIFPVCLKTLYNYVMKGLIKLKAVKHYKKPVKSIKYAKSIQKGDNITLRPEEANNRTEFGHFEGDLIVGKRNGSKECLFTLTDRFSRFELAYKIPNKSSESVIKILDYIENKIGTNKFKLFFKTITFDNGREFLDFKKLEQSINGTDKRVKIYYANPYCSWERGSNENANRMIRHYYPKGTDFESITKSNLRKTISKLNYIKRNCLHGISAIEFIKKTNSALLDTISHLNIKNPFLKLNYITLK